jgi:hypothetical protein
MGQEFSPRDPVFILHHGNIDRLWSVWRNLTTGGPHSDPSEAEWLQKTFPMPDASGVGFEEYRVADLLDTTPFGYFYDRERVEEAVVAASSGTERKSFVFSSERLDLRQGRASTDLVSGTSPEQPAIRELAARAAGASTLVLEDVIAPSETIVLSIYLKTDATRPAKSEDLVGFYTLLNPRGGGERSLVRTRVEIPLPDAVRRRLVKEPSVGFEIVADEHQQERAAGRAAGTFSIGEVRLVFE